MNAFIYYPFALIAIMIWLAGLLTSKTFLGFIEVLILITVVNIIYKVIRGKVLLKRKVKYRNIKN